jgi:hypothetical protein
LNGVKDLTIVLPDTALYYSAWIKLNTADSDSNIKFSDNAVYVDGVPVIESGRTYIIEIKDGIVCIKALTGNTRVDPVVYSISMYCNISELDGSASKIPSGGRAYATFTRGNAVLTGVDVYNPTISEARIEDCSVVSVSSSSAEGWVVFPLGVKAGISEAAFLLSVEGIEYEFDDTYFDEYVFSDDKYTFVVNIDSTTGKVIYVSSSYNY